MIKTFKLSLSKLIPPLLHHLYACYGFSKYLRGSADGLDGRSCDGVRESESQCMQGLPAKAEDVFSFAIEVVPDERMTDGRHMHADLVRASCFQAEAHQGVGVVLVNTYIMGDRFLTALLDDGPFCAMGIIVGDGCIDGAAWCCRSRG